MVVLATLMHLAWLGFFFFFKEILGQACNSIPSTQQIIGDQQKGK